MVIDFHSHILPGIDDGSMSVEDSIAMLKMEAEQGIEHIVATPHFNALRDDPERFLAERTAAEARLREEMERHAGLPRISVGAEVSFFPGMSHSDALWGLTIDKKKAILIEMPKAPWTDTMYRELEAIQTRQGLIPVIAHVDRYIRPFKTYQIPERLEELPVLIQANANFFLRSQTKRMALKMLRKEQVHLLGSDCHNLTTRAPNLGNAVKVIRQNLGGETIGRICFWQQTAMRD